MLMPRQSPTAPPTSAACPATCRCCRRRSRWSPAARATAGGPGRRPGTVATPLVGNDTDRITGGPTLAGHTYLAWAKFTGVVPRINTLEFSRTTNGGATWSRPVPVDQPGPFAGDYAPRILVLPGRDAAGRVRPRRCRAGALPVLRRPVT